MAVIMIIEDDTGVSYAVERILEQDLLETIPVYSGEDALKKLDEVTPDLITLDIMMPGIDGFETLKRIRERPETSTVPVIMVSVMDEVSDIVKGLEIGANDHITKPYNQTILLAKIRSLLRFKEMEDELRDYSRMMEKRAETNLKQYVEQLEETNRLKDLFSDILRHDMAGPLMVSGWYVDKLLEKEPDPEKAGYLRSVEKYLASAQELIKNARDLSMIENIGAFEFDDIDLAMVIKKVAEDYAPLASDAGMSIENNVTTDFPLKAHFMIEDVFSNLISNAIKYAHEGKHIVIDARDEGTSWMVRVTDFGNGIEDQYKENIFERFKRKEKEGVEGSGLGLAIAKRTVELHNGKIWVENNPKGGSIFCVMLPKEAALKKEDE